MVARNYRTKSGHGEIDLVAWQSGTLVFVEVKTRSTADFGEPDRAVDVEKRENLRRAARDYARRAEIPGRRPASISSASSSKGRPASTGFRTPSGRDVAVKAFHHQDAAASLASLPEGLSRTLEAPATYAPADAGLGPDASRWSAA